MPFCWEAPPFSQPTWLDEEPRLFFKSMLLSITPTLAYCNKESVSLSLRRPNHTRSTHHVADTRELLHLALHIFVRVLIPLY